MGQGKIKSSLLPESIRRERMWRDKTKWFAVAASLMVVGTGIAVGRLYADRVSYDNQQQVRTKIDSTTNQGRFDASLRRGTFAVVSGRLAKQSPDAMTLSTPSAILGVRGTEFVVSVQ